MRGIPSPKREAHVGAIVVILLAITLQVLTTIEVRGQPLRVGASDLLLAPLLAWMLWIWLRIGAPWPEWRVEHFWAWLAVLTLWMGVSLVNGRLYTGEWETWAVVNKGLGWLVVLAYLLLGGWMASFVRVGTREIFLKALLLFGWASCVFSLLYYFSYIHAIDLGLVHFEDPRPKGFFENPNAFGVFLAVLLALQAPFLRRRALFPGSVMYLGMGIALLALLTCRSRSAWIGLAVAWPALILLKQLRWTDVVKGAVVALLLGVILVNGPQLASIGRDVFLGNVVSVEREKSVDKEISGQDPEPAWKRRELLLSRRMMDSGVVHRLELSRQAFDMWLSAPLTGTGLGSFYWEQKTDDEPGAATIHTTVLWLLTETGLIGAALFVAFFFVCLKALLRRDGPDYDPFVLGVAGVLLVLAGASIGTEIMYQRYLWFLAGLALALPRHEKIPLAT